MLMEGGPQVVYSWELQLSTSITKPLLWAACHIRPRGWDEETETEPALKQIPSAFWILCSMFRNCTSTIDFRGKSARCVKTIGQLYILVELQEKPPWLAGFMQRIFFPEAGSHSAALAGLELTTYIRLTSHSQSSTCLCFPNAGIKGTQHHARLMGRNFMWSFCWKQILIGHEHVWHSPYQSCRKTPVALSFHPTRKTQIFSPP